MAGSACNEPGAYAARINDTEISARDFLEELEALRDNLVLAEMLGLNTAAPGTVNTDLSTAWLTRMIQDELVEQEAQRRDVEPDETQLQEALQLSIEQFNGEQGWNGFPEWFQRRIVERVALVLALEASVAGRPSEADVRAEFERTKDELGELACVSHILVEDRATAEEIRNQLGPDRPFSEMEVEFAQAAATLSTDTGSGQQGGDLGCQPRNTYVKPFEDFVWSGPVGRLSEPVETQFGFHIIAVRSRGAARFEDVAADVENRMREQSAQEFTAVMGEVVNESDIEVNPKFGTFDLASLTGRFVVAPQSPSPPDGPVVEDEGADSGVTVIPGDPGQAPPGP